MDTKNAEDRNQPLTQASKEAWLQKFGVTTPTDNALKLLADAQKVQTEASLSRNNRTVRESSDQNKARAGVWLAARIKQINADIDDLKKQLTSAQANATPSAPPLLPVVNSEGMVASGDELVANPSKSADRFSSAVLIVKHDLPQRRVFTDFHPFSGIKNPPVASIIDLDNEDSWRNAVDDGPDPWTKVTDDDRIRTFYSRPASRD